MRSRDAFRSEPPCGGARPRALSSGHRLRPPLWRSPALRPGAGRHRSRSVTRHENRNPRRTGAWNGTEFAARRPHPRRQYRRGSNERWRLPGAGGTGTGNGGQLRRSAARRRRHQRRPPSRRQPASLNSAPPRRPQERRIRRPRQPSAGRTRRTRASTPARHGRCRDEAASDHETSVRRACKRIERGGGHAGQPSPWRCRVR